MYGRILVPLDGSEQAEAALTFAMRLPFREIRLLRVDPDFEVDTGFLSDAEPSWRTLRTEQLREELARSALRHPGLGNRAELEVRFGDPAEEIIAAAADADLIVMTTRGRGAAGRAIYGSTADHVARHGTTPTLLVRSGDRPLSSTAPSRVLVPLDGSAVAEAALPEALKMATALGTPLHLVRVVDLDEILATVWFAAYAGRRRRLASEVAESERAAHEQEAARYLAAQVERLGDAGIPVTSEVLTGTPAVVLLDLAEPGDLVVMTSRGRGGLRRWLIGSVADKLVRGAAGPVLLVRTTPDTGSGPVT
jgi:nucleotide-binding universal stress UspA family protein